MEPDQRDGESRDQFGSFMKLKMFSALRIGSSFLVGMVRDLLLSDTAQPHRPTDTSVGTKFGGAKQPP